MSDAVANFKLNLDWDEEMESEVDLEQFAIEESLFDEEMDDSTPLPLLAVTSVPNPGEGKPSESKEFVDLSDSDVMQFISNQENQNTLKKTLFDIQKFERFLKKKGENRSFHSIPPDELDSFVANFILSAKKADGSEYEPSKLRNIISSLDRKLRRTKYPYCIMTERGPAFQLSRDALKAKQKSLKKMGKGNKAHSAKALTDEEIEILYEKDILGEKTPVSLLNTLWLNNTMHFGLRGTKENYNLRWGDVVLHKDSNGSEYLELLERQTKIRTGENICDVRSISPKMFANEENPQRDPVRYYKLYASKRPLGFCNPNAPFYIAPRTVSVSSDESDSHIQWYIKLPVGERKLSGMMKNMAVLGNLDDSKRLTNHSARKTLVQKLRNAGVPPTSIMQKNGHKNMQSVLNYSEMAENEQRQCSKILSTTSLPSNSLIASTGEVPASSIANDYPTHSIMPTCTSNNPDNLLNQNMTVASSSQNIMQSLFAGATLNVQNLHVHMK